MLQIHCYFSRVLELWKQTMTLEVSLNLLFFFSFLLLTLLEWMIPITVYEKKCKEMKIIESFQISATLFHLFLQSRFPTIWLTLLFPLAWRVKYMLIRLITCVKSLVPLILFTSTSFYVSERSAGSIWSIHFDMSLASNKKRKTSKGLLWDDTQMTSMKIVQFSYSPPSTSKVHSSSTPLTLNVQFQTKSPSPDDNQSIKRKHPRMTINSLTSPGFSLTSIHLAEASFSAFSRLYTLVCAIVRKCHEMSFIYNHSHFRNSFCNQPVLFALPENVNKLWNNNCRVHVNERNQNKSKTKSRQTQIDDTFCCSI